jgi:NDP-sugar pyrophosphorylase family protein
LKSENNLQDHTEQSLNQLTAIILAGGLGTRLRSVVADRPKVLAEVLGRPFLSYLLDQVEAAGVKQVVLCTGHLGEQVEEAFGKYYGSLRLIYSQEKEQLGTAGALQHALPLFDSEWALGLNGDSYCDANLADFWQASRSNGAAGSILLVEMPDTERYGRVNLSSERRVESFDEKGIRGPGLINAGIYLLNRQLLQSIPTGRAVSIEREMFPMWVRDGIYGHQNRARFLDIGTPESYSIAERFFASRL